MPLGLARLVADVKRGGHKVAQLPVQLDVVGVSLVK
jgi:hypothetical protein